MGRFKNKIWAKLIHYRDLYPTTRLGVMGTVNQRVSAPPLCPCGKNQMLFIWHSTGLEKICLECEGEEQMQIPGLQLQSAKQVGEGDRPGSSEPHTPSDAPHQ
jgi:hypothetical protein